jgi:uncharacterized protein YggE
MLKSLVALSLAVATPLLAQETPTPPHELTPSISTSGLAEAKVTPDRATIYLSVQTQDKTAASAAAQNAKKQTAVLAALRALGLSNKQLSTTSYTVSPNYRYEQNKEPTLVGYTVTNTIVADIQDINQVGKVIDAALQNGSNMVSSLNFTASKTDSARHVAIASAVAQARAEAEAAARAAGGSLGALLELNVNSQTPIPPRPMYMKTAARDVSESTPINPEDQTLTVNVFTRWRFVQR